MDAFLRAVGTRSASPANPSSVAAPARALVEEAVLAEGGTAVPTETFFPMRTQSRLAELGVVGLGSGKNTDVQQLTAAPMVYGGEHKVPLPAQILMGRIVRFAQWVRD